MARTLGETDREIALRLLDADVRNAYEKYRRAKIFLRDCSALDAGRERIENKFGKPLLSLQVVAYCTRDLRSVVPLPSPDSPFVPKTATVFELRADLAVLAQLADELVAAELLPEYGSRPEKDGGARRRVL